MPIAKTPKSISRRHFLATSAVATTAIAGGATTSVAAGGKKHRLTKSTFEYEVTRTEEEWRSQLSNFEYKILREDDTELPHTSPLTQENAPGKFHCKGCDLESFASDWRVPIDKGWVFFAHAEDNSVLTSIDGPQEAYGMNPNGFGNLIEVHCRRCGSHLGHHLIVNKEMVYCINGTAVNFKPTSA